MDGPTDGPAEEDADEAADQRTGDLTGDHSDRFCRWCGQEQGECGGGCRRELDPPRACPRCGRRLRVLVVPTGFEATCRDHGPVHAT